MRGREEVELGRGRWVPWCWLVLVVGWQRWQGGVGRLVLGLRLEVDPEEPVPEVLVVGVGALPEVGLVLVAVVVGQVLFVEVEPGMVLHSVLVALVVPVAELVGLIVDLAAVVAEAVPVLEVVVEVGQVAVVTPQVVATPTSVV